MSNKASDIYERAVVTCRSTNKSNSTTACRKCVEAEIKVALHRATKRAAYDAARVERAALPQHLEKVLNLAYNVVFDIIMNKPSAEDCVKKCLEVSPALHASLYPSMHG